MTRISERQAFQHARPTSTGTDPLARLVTSTVSSASLFDRREHPNGAASIKKRGKEPAAQPHRDHLTGESQ